MPNKTLKDFVASALNSYRYGVPKHMLRCVLYLNIKYASI